MYIILHSEINDQTNMVTKCISYEVSFALHYPSKQYNVEREMS